MRRTVSIAISLLTAACAGRVDPSMRHSSEPRGTDRTLIPAALVQLDDPGKVAMQLVRPAFVTVYERIPRTDSLRLVFSTPAELTVPLDGTYIMGIAAAVRSSLAARPISPFVRESCVDVPLGAGDPVGVRMCSANQDIVRERASLPERRWHFTNPLVVIATAAPYPAPERMPIAWFHRIDGEPPMVRGEWAAFPFGAADVVARAASR